MADITISDINENNGTLVFTLDNINVSLANAIRRVILADINLIVFRTSPYEKNDAEFLINTCRLNNEILKQRLSCIPIHISDLDMPIDDYLLEVDVKNDSDTITYVTTSDFKIKNIKTDKYLNETSLRNIFPPDPITNEYIDFARLRPRISDSISGEHLKFTCKFSKGTAKENSCFNCVSTCSYRNIPDTTKIEEVWAMKLAELDLEKTNVEFAKKDFMLLQAKRIFIPDTFEFRIETIGVLDNQEILKKSVQIIIDKLTNLNNIFSKPNDFIIKSNTTIPNSFDILLEKEDYTIGKIIEFMLYDNYYIKNDILTFCGFQKPHPHIDLSIIRIGYKIPTDTTIITENLLDSIKKATDIYTNLLTNINSQM